MGSAERRSNYSFGQQVEFIRKELRETLRDRRTIITLMVMPLLLYPLLGLGLRFIAFQQGTESEVEYRLAVATEKEASWLSGVLSVSDPRSSSQDELESSTEGKDEPNIQLLMPNEETKFDVETMVTTSTADVGLRVELSGDRRKATVQLIQNETSERSREVSQYLERRLADTNIRLIESWASQRNQDLTIPIEQSLVSLTPADSGSPILGLLPLVLLLMTITGGVYPAIDLTAGERERNTMETLMALPVPRIRLLVAKYVAVVAVTILTGLMNLLAMGCTLYALQLDKSLLGENGFTLLIGGKLFLALATFAMFYSAVLLLITSSAKSFKEAQAYLIPLLLLSIAPGMVVFLPDWSLGTLTAAIPLVNILLLSKEMLQGTVQALPASVAIISTVFYGLAALSFAAPVFGRDAVAVGSRSSWKDFRRPKSVSLLPSLPAALSTLALLFPAFFIASGILSRGEMEPGIRLAYSAGLTIALFVGVPWLVLFWRRVVIEDGLGLKSAGIQYWAAALLLGLATWPWVFELVLFANSLGIRGFDPSKVENVESLLAGWREVPLWLIVICLGVVPGICEECFFRGYLFSGLKQHFNAAGTILISAVAFGLFHVVMAGGVTPERIFPSTLMGLLLGYVAWQSKSVLPSMLLHAIHNSTLLVVVQSRDKLAEWNIGQVQQEHLPWWWLATSGLTLAVAFAMTRFSGKRAIDLAPAAVQS